MIKTGAKFSVCRTYRYGLWRVWGDQKQMLAFIGLNPSTADENVDDPTIRRCIRFAHDWGFGALMMLNLFAYRTTDPRLLERVEDPIGPLNDEWIGTQARACGGVVAAWGHHGGRLSRDQAVMSMLDGIHVLALGTTHEGHPRHPLYVAAKTKPFIYKGRRL